jgi:hypothetical protein
MSCIEANWPDHKRGGSSASSTQRFGGVVDEKKLIRWKGYDSMR